MRPARVIFAYLAAIVIGGALLAPWLFWLVQWLAANVEVCAGLARHPFKRIFNRSLLIIALAGLWPFWRALGYRSVKEVGFTRDARWWIQLWIGGALGLGSLTVLVLVTGTELDWSAASWSLAGRLVLTAGAVAVIEETFFRGALQGALQKKMPPWGAVALASAMYSAVHFLKPTGFRIEAGDVGWASGLACLGQIFSQSFARPEVLIGFVTLALAGSILGLGYRRSGGLYFSIGLHAGWVWPNEWVRELGRISLLEDWRAWPVLLVMLWAVYRWRPPSSPI